MREIDRGIGVIAGAGTAGIAPDGYAIAIGAIVGALRRDGLREVGAETKEDAAIGLRFREEIFALDDEAALNGADESVKLLDRVGWTVREIIHASL